MQKIGLVYALIIAREEAYIMMIGAAARVVAAAGALNARAGVCRVEAGALVRDGTGRDIAPFRDMLLWGEGGGTLLLYHHL